ncbi:MAG TPA: J domain-containing protein [Euzebyales bacterium]|nr:J domain-containing protein [Euzebyales bacterium]
MAVRDLYEILGVGRDADQEHIKRAYRRKAREVHPDAGGSEDDFKELTTAYEVLRNPETRANYDRFGDPRGPGGMAGGGDPFAGFGDLSDLIDSFFGGGFARSGSTRTASSAGRDALIDITIDLGEAASGATREIDVDVMRACDTCSGTGDANGSGPVSCSTCNGTGGVQQVTRSIFGQMLTTSTCPTCRGSGRRVEHPCPACSGEGRRRVQEQVSVDVPPGVDSGTRLRLSGRGEAGRMGGRSGDLFVRIRVRPHDVFERDGNDLHCRLRLPMVQAALGVEIEVPTIDGSHTLVVPPGTQPETVLSVRRGGMPKLNGGGARGDLYVHCQVEIPTGLDDQQRDLLRELAEVRGEDRPGSSADRGLFDRLRGVFGG